MTGIQHIHSKVCKLNGLSVVFEISFVKNEFFLPSLKVIEMEDNFG